MYRDKEGEYHTMYNIRKEGKKRWNLIKRMVRGETQTGKKKRKENLGLFRLGGVNKKS